jgi:hypothetical protein
MKLVFSRKGFDSSTGGFPSPIINGKPISLPIPYPSSKVSYRHFNLGKIVRDLTGRKLAEKDLCHNDPDLEMGAFGQASSAQSHLHNQSIGCGDLFLFFGLEKQRLWIAIIATKEMPWTIIEFLVGCLLIKNLT